MHRCHKTLRASLLRRVAPSRAFTPAAGSRRAELSGDLSAHVTPSVGWRESRRLLLAVAAAIVCGLVGCAANSQLRREEDVRRLYDLEIPVGNVARCEYATELASEVRCDAAKAVLSLVDPGFAGNPYNESGILNIHASCALYEDGDAETAETIARGVFEQGVSNLSRAAYLVAEARMHGCDFDGAREWIYRAESAHDESMAARSLMLGAWLDVLGGRPAAAAVALDRFLVEFPSD